MTFENVTEEDLLALAKSNLTNQFNKNFPRTARPVAVASERPALVVPVPIPSPTAGAGCLSQPETNGVK
jgi:hypothetical protein